MYNNISKDNNNKFPKPPIPHSKRWLRNSVESALTVLNYITVFIISLEYGSFITICVLTHSSQPLTTLKTLYEHKNIEENYQNLFFLVMLKCKSSLLANARQRIINRKSFWIHYTEKFCNCHFFNLLLSIYFLTSIHGK